MTETSFAAIVSAARRDTGMSAAEFDYALSRGVELGHQAYQSLDNAIYYAANLGHPEVTPGAADVVRDRRDRADAVRARFQADIDALVANAKTMSYTGWSTASHEPIRYAR